MAADGVHLEQRGDVGLLLDVGQQHDALEGDHADAVDQQRGEEVLVNGDSRHAQDLVREEDDEGREEGHDGHAVQPDVNVLLRQEGIHAAARPEVGPFAVLAFEPMAARVAHFAHIFCK